MLEEHMEYDARPRAEGVIVRLSIDRADMIESIMHTVENSDDVTVPEWYTDLKDGVETTFDNVRRGHRDNTRSGYGGISNDRVDPVMVPDYMVDFLSNLFELVVENGVTGPLWNPDNGRGTPEESYEKYGELFNSTLSFNCDIPELAEMISE